MRQRGMARNDTETLMAYYINMWHMAALREKQHQYAWHQWQYGGGGACDRQYQ